MVASQNRILKGTNVNRTFYSSYWCNLKLRRQFLTKGTIYLVVPQFHTEGSIYLVVQQFLTEGSIYLVVSTVPYRRIYLPCGSNSSLQKDLSCGSNSSLQKDLSTLWFQQFLIEGSIYLVVPTVPYRRIYLPCGSNSP